jgi:hypothetical protein
MDVYYLAQAKTIAGTWISLGVSSTSLEEVNTFIADYSSSHPRIETRVVQKLVNPPRTAKKVPGCC